MMFRKFNQSKDRKKQAAAARQEKLQREPSAENLHQIAMEMNWGEGMLPLGGFPDGPWHWY